MRLQVIQTGDGRVVVYSHDRSPFHINYAASTSNANTFRGMALESLSHTPLCPPPPPPTRSRGGKHWLPCSVHDGEGLGEGLFSLI